MWSTRRSQALYNAAWALSLPFVFARFWWRGRAEAAYFHGWSQRLGHWTSPDPPVDGGPRVWLHAVSLGETRAAGPLVQALRNLLPGMQLLLTTSTATGMAAGRELLQAGDLHGWVPLDTPAATRRFLAVNRPQVGVLMETETWPNLLLQAQVAGVPMALVNARLSDRSLRKGLRWSGLTRPMMGRLTVVCAQSDRDARNLQQAGVPADRIQVLGHLKYDLQPSLELLDQGRQWARQLPSGATACVRPSAARRIVMAASWREGEDQALLRAWGSQVLTQAAGRSGPWVQPDAATPHGKPAARPLLLVVPRHPQRFGEVHAAMVGAGLSVSRRSHWGPEGPSEANWQADAWLGDSVGEMPAYYAASDVALLGGSFAALGGQNLIEAAACACPVVMGPHTFNFSDAAAQAQDLGAAWRACDVAQAVSLALKAGSADLQQARAAGLAWVAAHSGAVQRQARAVAALIQLPRSGAKA